MTFLCPEGRGGVNFAPYSSIGIDFWAIFLNYRLPHGTDAHPAIIQRDVFAAVQAERKKRSNVVIDETGTRRKTAVEMLRSGRFLCG